VKYKFLIYINFIALFHTHICTIICTPGNVSSIFPVYLELY